MGVNGVIHTASRSYFEKLLLASVHVLDVLPLAPKDLFEGHGQHCHSPKEHAEFADTTISNKLRSPHKAEYMEIRQERGEANGVNCKLVQPTGETIHTTVWSRIPTYVQ